MEDTIINFPKQFDYVPEIGNVDSFVPGDRFIVAGMGGSALASLLIRILAPHLRIHTHRNYGLPDFGEELGSYTIIAVSYSGNTEETISAWEEARTKNLPTVAIATGGQLLERAKREGAPFIEMPDHHIQPRCALGLMTRAVLSAMNEKVLLKETDALARLAAETLKPEGKALAESLREAIPLIYASEKNRAIAYSWKIKFNETGKIHAFANVFPEMNHNELSAFGADTGASVTFYPILIEDASDDPRIQKRMRAFKELLSANTVPYHSLELSGETLPHKIFSSLLLADWAAYYVALLSGHEPERVPLIEDFKKRIA